MTAPLVNKSAANEISLISTLEYDIEKRSIRGVYIYVFAWLVIGIGSDLHKVASTYFYLILATFSLFSITRTIAYVNTKKLLNHSKVRWWQCLYLNTLGPALTISFVFTMSLISPELKPSFMYLLMALLAFALGGAVSFAPNKKIMICYLLAICVPPITITAFTPAAQVESVMLAAFTLFAVTQGIRLNKEYLESHQQKVMLQELTVKDSLTGIYNRRYFDATLDQTWKIQHRIHQPISLILVDIDHFKQVNDTYGHNVGDLAIKQVAEKINDNFQRAGDTVARIGGEEFAIILANVDSEDVEQLVQKLRKNIEKQLIQVDGKNIKLTVSIGFTNTTPEQGMNQIELMKVTDNALYKAKAQGRNMVVRYEYKPE